jgi:hypothetical protein
MRWLRPAAVQVRSWGIGMAAELQSVNTVGCPAYCVVSSFERWAAASLGIVTRCQQDVLMCVRIMQLQQLLTSCFSRNSSSSA